MQKFRATAPFSKKYAGDYNLDYLLLVAQGYQESGLDQKVKSPVGAVGIMQVMPKTAVRHQSRSRTSIRRRTTSTRVCG